MKDLDQLEKESRLGVLLVLVIWLLIILGVLIWYAC